MIELTLDSTATTELVVAASDLASALPLDSRDAFPAVFATARMVALMEIASARLLQPVLAPGQLSVGVSVEVIHSAPTPPGATVTATARYIGRDGKLFAFEVVASDCRRGWPCHSQARHRRCRAIAMQHLPPYCRRHALAMTVTPDE